MSVLNVAVCTRSPHISNQHIPYYSYRTVRKCACIAVMCAWLCRVSRYAHYYVSRHAHISSRDVKRLF